MKRVTALALVTGIMLTMVSCGNLEKNTIGESKKNAEVKKRGFKFFRYYSHDNVCWKRQ